MTRIIFWCGFGTKAHKAYQSAYHVACKWLIQNKSYGAIFSPQTNLFAFENESKTVPFKLFLNDAIDQQVK